MSASYRTKALFKSQSLSLPKMQGDSSEDEQPKESKLKFLPELPISPFTTRLTLFANDTSTEKLELLRGMVITEAGEPHLMNVVHEAERRIHERKTPHGYQFSIGREEFRAASAKLLFGENSPLLAEGRVATVQTLSGTGALSLGASFLHRLMQRTEIYVSDPGWENYAYIFPHAGLERKTYRYFDPNARGLNFEGMCTDIANALPGSIILLQGCAHNPTGCDPTKEQWEKICEICKEKEHLPFFDIAYQGIASGSLDEDAYAPRLFAQNGSEFLVAQSYSKNLGIYGERVGALHFVLNDKQIALNVPKHLRSLIGASYICPPVHGSYLVCEIFESPELSNQWKEELRTMAASLVEKRQALYNRLKEPMPEMDWSVILQQKGMFIFLGLTTKQNDYLMKQHHVYLTMDGRISLGALLKTKTQYLAKALVDTYKNC